MAGLAQGGLAQVKIAAFCRAASISSVPREDCPVFLACQELSFCPRKSIVVLVLCSAEIMPLVPF